MDVLINWNFPEPRKGLAGAWDKFVGPGATLWELVLMLVPPLMLSVFTILNAYQNEIGWSIIQYLIAALLAFDIAGGITTNATSCAKRWYHRKQQGFWQHLGFVIIHLFQIGIVGLMFRDFDYAFIICTFSFLLASSAIVLSVPLYIQRSLALFFTSAAIILGKYCVFFSATEGLEWFIPFLFIKLLISHLTKEEPYAAD